MPTCQLLGKRQAPGPALPEEEPVVRVDHLTWAGRGRRMPGVGDGEEQVPREEPAPLAFGLLLPGRWEGAQEMRGEPQAGLRWPGGGCHPGLNCWAPAPRDVAQGTPLTAVWPHSGPAAPMVSANLNAGNSPRVLEVRERREIGSGMARGVGSPQHRMASTCNHHHEQGLMPNNKVQASTVTCASPHRPPPELPWWLRW